MRKLLLLVLVILMSFGLKSSYSANMTDYCYIPPIAGLQVKPNVLIVMDFSGSMQFPAYVPCTFGGYSNYRTDNRTLNVALCGANTATSSSSWKYDPSKTYYGYFDPNRCYTYNGSLGAFQENSCNCSNRIGTSSCISGNLLNWITTTRIDIARWVLTGGRTSPSNPNTLESEGATYTIYDNNLKCSFTVSASTTTSRVLTISNFNGTCPISITNANIKIRPSDPSSIKGVIHSFCDTSDLNGQINEKCQLIMQFMVFASDSRYGLIRVGKNATISDLINGINRETPYFGTPTGEALWEAYDYYKQSNDNSYESNSAYINRGNGTADPYYDYSGGNSRPVPCRKGFVLLISDGAWNGRVDPVVPARIMATQDLRADIPGKQNVYTYAIYAFGDTDPTTALQGKQAMITTAIFGGFDDKDGNTWPYPFTNIQYPNGSGICSSLEGTVSINIQTPTTTYCNSRGVVYPLPECNPSGTWNSQCAEWDTAFNSPKDGLPYNFYEASDAPTLKSALISALTDILRRASSGATVATLTSRTSVSSLIVQPYYYPKYIRQDGKEVSWLGFLRSFWIDTMQNLREDSTEPKVLNMAGAAIDKIFQFFFDPNANETKVAILQGSYTTSSCVMEGTKSINQLIPVFDAGCQLANRDPSDRKILYNKDGTLTSFTTSESSYLSNIWKVCSNDPTVLCTDNGDCGGGTCQTANASCIIRYLRGENLSSDSSCPDYVKRTREVDIAKFCPGASGTKTWKIGDIINSTPSVVSSEPVNIYHLRYNDTTYLQYIRTDAYKNRTSFVFVSANDGMLHAFRIGRTVQTGDTDKPTRVVNAYNDMSNDLVGREEWAFIPRNALPYLVWYGNPNYCRVPTVDYRTVIFDASIGGPANADKTVSSWRTILIGTMGFGGKAITTSAGTFSSSVFALDLTDWLNGTSTQPTLLWEVRLPDGTLTTSYPAVIRLGDPNKNGEWYVVIGSGPLNPEGTSFTSQPKLYFIDLRSGNIVNQINIPATGGVSFAVGDIAVVDVDNDYQDDVIYFGVYGKTNTGNVWGNFYRLSLRSGTGYKSVSSLTQSDVCIAIDLGTFATAGNTPPVFGAPSFTKDENGKLWVFFGTGRYVMDSSDKAISYDNYLIGFKDENWNSGTCPTAYTRAQLTDITDQPLTITITEVKQVCMCDASGCGMQNVVYDAYSSSMPSEPPIGWYYRLTGEAIYSQPLVIGGIVDALTYVPPQDICQMEGKSNLISVYYKTGRPYPRPSVLSPKVVSGTIEVGNSVQLGQKISVGQGIPPIGNPFQALQSSQASQQLEKFAQVSTGVVLRMTQQKATTSEEKFLLWIEK
ncbi:PilC/PilY family type IV pilus protein [Thermocrinis sp.]|uniref:pilus assembly protein n=1 Tax=Thermocrinis sp. TaxID=2024383 RepID=UPI002612E7D9|nr:PilC/PilY family type IV pilus protein [Thermocrinis sp.]